MDDTYLILAGGESQQQLFLAESNAARDQITLKLFGYRLSPIFPVSGAAAAAPQLKQPCLVAIYAVDNPFVAIGTLIATAECDETRLWFSYGVSSLLYFAKSAEDVERTSQALSGTLRSVEIWEIENHVIRSCEYTLIQCVEFDPALYQVTPPSAEVEADTSYVVTEISHAMRSLVPLAAQFSPSLLPIYQSFTVEINKVVDNLNRLAASLRPVGDDYTLDDHVVDQQRINVVTDLLVQINSMIAYGHTQAFGGASPVLENRSFVHSHSLFGIGTAVLAIHAVMSKVDQAFTKMPVSSIVRSFGVPAPVNVFRHLGEVDLAIWEEIPARVDHIYANLQQQPGSDRGSHLLFFSGRLGFQEAKHSISAALQAIPLAATIRWTPLTLSHEIMHAHVRDLLTSLFVAHVEPGAVPRDFSELHGKYRAFISRGDAPASLRDSIRFALMNYIRWRRSFTTSESVNGQFKFRDVQLSEEESWKALRAYYREMNEIIVHVLDFKYFYDSDRDLYTDYLWQSWSTVPSVLANVEHYVLRSLATLSITLTGTLDNRFRLARQLLGNRIAGLAERFGSSALFEKVLQLLTDDYAMSRITALSLANQYLAELTAHFLFSSQIAGLLSADENLDVTDEVPRYELNAGEFPGEPVQSPISLLLDRVRRVLRDDGTEGELTEQFRAAWLYLACASFRP